MGSKITGTEPEQPSTIRATGAGIVRLEGDNTFYEVGTVETVAGTTLLVTTVSDDGRAMPQSNITVGNSADMASSVLTFVGGATPTTFAVGTGKTLTTETGNGATLATGGKITVTDKSVLDAHLATVTIKAATTVEVEAGGKITF